MATRYKFELADRTDDADLRFVLRHTAMPGDVSLSLQREPDFFVAECAGSVGSQVIVVRESSSGRIVGFGCRSFRNLHVDGEVRKIGYLSGLRGLPEVRSGTLLARAYQFFKELHGDKQVPYYVTTIFDDNIQAKNLLTSRRAGLPTYEFCGHLYTYLLPLYAGRRSSAADCRAVRGLGSTSEQHQFARTAQTRLSGKAADSRRRSSADSRPDADPRAALVRATVECLNEHNRRHLFSPFYTAADLLGRTSMLPNFDASNLYVYREGNVVAATLGVWDQSSFKQSMVAGYSWPYRLARPLSKIGAMFKVSARLPRVGEAMPCLYAALLGCSGEQPQTLASLLAAAMNDWSNKGYAYLLLGAHERSPFNNLLRRMSALRLSSSIYRVYWEDKLECELPTLNSVPNLELATL